MKIVIIFDKYLAYDSKIVFQNDILQQNMKIPIFEHLPETLIYTQKINIYPLSIYPSHITNQGYIALPFKNIKSKQIGVYVACPEYAAKGSCP